MNLGTERNTMFARKTDVRPFGAGAEAGSVVPMPERAARPEPPRPAAATQAATTAREEPSRAAHKPALISQGVEFHGDMTSDGALTVDGVIRGNLVLKTLIIGTTGVVDGSVRAESISVEGSLSGVVECNDLVVGSSALVDGKLHYTTVTIQRGGTVKGELARN
jgi:cytoskeletal protein CcmA (bactofilin family)